MMNTTMIENVILVLKMVCYGGLVVEIVAEHWAQYFLMMKSMNLHMYLIWDYIRKKYL